MLKISRQPFGKDHRLGDLLNAQLRDSTWTRFDAAIAFARSSGVKFIFDGVRDFVGNNRDIRISVGVDLQGTSVEGLSLLREAVKPYSLTIVHSTGVSTFHPKIYLFRNDTRAEVIVGSGNLTAGGLYTNFEGSISVALDLSDTAHLEFLQEIDALLLEWSECGAAKKLDDELLAALEEAALILPEAKLSSAAEKVEVRTPKGGDTRTAIFEALRVPNPPSLTVSADKAGASPPRIATKKSALRGFVMTLQKTDVGVGQTTSGAARRSPEVFIPLAARNYASSFWGWPELFSEDRGRPDKWDRQEVKMRVGGRIEPVNMMTWPVKHDFRLRSEALRSAGDIGDILRLELASADKQFDYYAAIVPIGSTEYGYYDSICSNKVRNSKKRWGYY